MTISALMNVLPELLLLVGASVVLLAGVTRVARRAAALPLITAAFMIAALLATLAARFPEDPVVLPGLTVTTLTYYVRWLTLVVGLLLLLLNWRQADPLEQGEYLSMMLFAMVGLLLTASASDLVVLFFAIELVSIPTYILVALSRRDVRASEAAVKYFFLGALSAALLAYGFAFFYGASGGTALASLSRATADPSNRVLILIGWLLAFGGLSFKIAAVPFHAYAADVYEGAASPVTALLGFVPKLAGFVALLRIMEAMNWSLPQNVLWVIWIVAAATMTVGNVLGLLQNNVKRMLAYSSIAHSGYMLVALLVGPTLGEGPMSNGVTALLFYIAVYGVMNLGAFAALSAFQHGDRPIETVDDLSGLARRHPGPALALALCVFSLMGFPPTAGFLGKVYIFSGAFSAGADHPFRTPLAVLAVIAVINSAIGAAYYLRIVASCYMNRPREAVTRTAGLSEQFALSLAGAAMLVCFFAPQSLLTKARTGAAVEGPRTHAPTVASRTVDPPGP